MYKVNGVKTIFINIHSIFLAFGCICCLIISKKHFMAFVRCNFFPFFSIVVSIKKCLELSWMILISFASQDDIYQINKSFSKNKSMKVEWNFEL